MAEVTVAFRRLRWAALAITLVFASAVNGRTQGPSEYQVKAAYLYGFGRFVEWPASSPAASGTAFVLCVLGADPFGRVIDEVAANAVMKEEPVRIHRISRLDESEPCHTLFISSSEDVQVAKLLEGLNHRAVLTVSDAPQFAQRGGMIGFSVESNRVRFTVNLGAAKDAGLTLNSELLRVAAAVLRVRQQS
jgi:hypothetical protein